MSKSPRRLLRRAADALRELDELSAKHPEVRQELVLRLGHERLREIDRAASMLASAADDVDRDPATDTPG